MDIIIITPTWHPEDYHPHHKRVCQWIDSCNSLMKKPTVVSICKKDSTYYQPQDSFQLLLKKNIIQRGKINSVKLKVKKIQLLIKENKISADSIVIITHPMLLHILENNKFSKVIVDFPDVPLNTNNFIEWGYTYKMIENYLKQCSIVVNQQREVLRFKKLFPDIANIVSILPVLTNFSTPIYSNIKGICFLGGKSQKSFEAFEMAYIPIKENVFFSSIFIKVIGGLAEKVKSKYPELICKSEIDNLEKEINSFICPVIEKKNQTGISTRVIDIIDNNGYLIASYEAVEGYEMAHYPVLFNTKFDYIKKLNMMLRNKKLCINITKNLKVVQVHKSIFEKNTMNNLLKLTFKTEIHETNCSHG